MSRLVRISDESHKTLRDIAYNKCVPMSYLLDLAVRNIADAKIISVSLPEKKEETVVIDSFLDRLSLIKNKFNENQE